jgi:hypothetical protein
VVLEHIFNNFKTKMPFEHWEEFVAFAHRSIIRYFANPEASLDIYLERLTTLSSEVIGEKSRTLLDPNLSPADKRDYIERMNIKIDYLLTNLFEERPEGSRYLPDGFLLTEENPFEVSSARALQRNIIGLQKEFQKECNRIYKLNHLPTGKFKRGKRIPSRASFEIMEGKDVNLRAVHARLTDEAYPFIDIDTTYDSFDTVFSGNPVINKVSWLNANALHYFINRIHGKGIKKANEGQWNRAAKCFTVKGRDFTPDQITDAGDPVASITAVLDRAIEHFL